MHVKWKAAQLAVLMIIAGCDTQPNQSYTFPTAIVGVSVMSVAEGDRIKRMLEEVAKDQGLIRYRPSEEPGSAEMQRPDAVTAQVERMTSFEPRFPSMRTGFSIQLEEYSPQCFVISVSEWSGTWTRRTLRQFERIHGELLRITSGRAKLFVRPKPEQNWPMQQQFEDPERPTYLAELCVRLGFPDPRSAPEIASQGPLSVQESWPNKTMEPTR